MLGEFGVGGGLWGGGGGKNWLSGQEIQNHHTNQVKMGNRRRPKGGPKGDNANGNSPEEWFKKGGCAVDE